MDDEPAPFQSSPLPRRNAPSVRCIAAEWPDQENRNQNIKDESVSMISVWLVYD